MRFNGIDLKSVHRALSIEKEIPPGTAEREFETISTKSGDIISEERLESGKYTVRVNIVGRTPEEGWNVRELLAGWATTRGLATAELIPTHRPNRCYDAKIQSISEPEFVHGGAKVTLTFFIPRPVTRDVNVKTASGGGKMTARIGGTYSCRPAIKQIVQTARTGIVWTMDGVPILRIKGELDAGAKIVMDTLNESLTIDGVHAENRIDVSDTKWQPGYWPGTHKIVSTDGGVMEMRWHDEWL